jgi:antitoxin CptB
VLSESANPETLPVQTTANLLDDARLRRLRWRCRRGLLENDLFIERFFDRYAPTLTVGQAQGLYDLMELSDNDLMDLLLGRREPQGSLTQAHTLEVLTLLRA